MFLEYIVKGGTEDDCLLPNLLYKFNYTCNYLEKPAACYSIPS